MHCLSYLGRPIGVTDSPVGVRSHPLWIALQHAQTHSTCLPMSSSLQSTTSGNIHAVVFNARNTEVVEFYDIDRGTPNSSPSSSSSRDVRAGSATTVQNCAEFCKDTCAPCVVQQNSRRRSMIAVIVLLLMPGLALCATPPCFNVSDKQTQHGLMTQALSLIHI